ncbi:Talin-1 [Cichlidogyrus casuarinus]|uniref:Talin-1 n=1 Tax=Cichlidogyrus casuarinus TaxID=1844966 RepID=A0ABD2Q6T5_9PLAT
MLHCELSDRIMPWTFPSGTVVDGDYPEALTLRVQVPSLEITKTMRFEPHMTIEEVCDRIRLQISSLHHNDKTVPSDYGIFHTNDDEKKGLWLNNTRNLEHYMLQSGDTIQYRCRLRWLFIKTLDGNRKKLCVDDSKTVAELMLPICVKIGIQNYEEYALVREVEDSDQQLENRQSTLRKSHLSISAGENRTPAALIRQHEQEKMDRLKKKLHTDDDISWLNPAQSLRQQGIDQTEVLVLRRRYFFSDMNVDSRDPVQLNLLYLQLKDAILNGTHPITQEEALMLAGLQVQVDFGNRYQPGDLEMSDCLPKEYARLKNIERKVMQYHASCYDTSQIDAKMKYCQFCRSLQTYGITFFLVKEKVKGKSKLIPRLLGVSKDSVIRMDEKTKEILKIWPLTSVYKIAASQNAFTMDFGEYSPDEYYTAQTTEGEHISQLISGYIDISLKKQKARDQPGDQADEEAAMFIETVACEQAEVVPTSQILHTQTERFASNGTNGHGPKHPVDVGMNEALFVGTEQHTSTARHYNMSQQKFDYTDANYGDEFATSQQQQHYSSTAISRQRVQSPDSFLIGGSQYVHYREIKQARRDLLNTINDNLRVIELNKNRLDIGDGGRVWPQLGDDKNSHRWIEENLAERQTRVTDEIGAMNAAVAQTLRSTSVAKPPPDIVVQQADDNGEDLMMMQQSFRIITVQFPALINNVREMAVLRRESNQLRQQEQTETPLLQASHSVADRFSELMTSARPFATFSTADREDEQDRLKARQEIVEAVNRVSEANQDLLAQVRGFNGTRVTLFDQQEHEHRSQLNLLTNRVVTDTADLVSNSKQLSSALHQQPDAQNRVILVATDIATAAKQLHDCNKLLGATIRQPPCQEQMLQASNQVSQSIYQLLRVTRTSADSVRHAMQTGQIMEEELEQARECISATESSAKTVVEDLDAINAYINSFSIAAHENDLLSQFDQCYERVINERDPTSFHTASRQMVEVTHKLVQHLYEEAQRLEHEDPERNHRLLQLTNAITPTLSETVNLIKELGGSVNETEIQTGIRSRAETLREDLYGGNVELMGPELMHSLITAATASLSTATQLNNAVKSAAQHSRPPTNTVLSDSRNVDEIGSRLAVVLQRARNNPQAPLEQMELLQASEQFLIPAERFVDGSRSFMVTISEHGLQNTVQMYSDHCQTSLNALRLWLRRTEPWARQLIVSNSLLKLESLRQEAEDLRKWVPPPQASADTSRFLGSGANHLLFDAVREGMSASGHLKQDYVQRAPEASCDDWAGNSAGDLVSSMSHLLEATTVFKADSNSDRPGDCVLQPSALNQLNDDCVHTIHLAYQLLLKSLLSCLTALPGQRELAEAAAVVAKRRSEVQHLTTLGDRRELPPAKEVSVDEMQVLQQEIATSAREFHEASSELMVAESGGSFADAAQRFSAGLDALFDAGQRMAQASVPGTAEHARMPDGLNRDITACLLDVADHSLDYLDEARAVCGHPAGRPLRDGLHQRGRATQESITRLLLVNDSSLNPALLACEEAIRQVSAMALILQAPRRPFTNNPYYGCILEASHIIGNMNEGIAGMGKARGQQDYCRSVKIFADSVCNLMEESAQAAYLVGITDVRSDPGRPSNINYDLLTKLQSEISQSCVSIASTEMANTQLIAVSEEANSKLSVLENLVSAISDQADSTGSRKQLLDLMDRLVISIGSLTQNSANWSPEGQKLTQVHATKAQSELNELVQLIVSSGHFGGQAGVIAEQAKESQKPICEAAKSSLDAAKSLLTNSKNLPPVVYGNEPSSADPEALKQFTDRSADVVNSIKALLLAMETFAPGQAECKQVLQHFNDSYLPDLQQLRTGILQENLPPSRKESEEMYQKHMMLAVKAIRDSVPKLAQVARCEAEQLGHLVMQLDDQLASIVKNTSGAASCSSAASSQLAYTEHARGILESAEHFVRCCKQAGGNPNASQCHQPVFETRNQLITACDECLQSLVEISDRQGQVTSLMDTIGKSKSQVKEFHWQPKSDSTQSGSATLSVRTTQQYPTRLLRLAERMQQQTEDILIRARERDSGHKLIGMARILTEQYKEIVPLTHSTIDTLDSDKDAQVN